MIEISLKTILNLTMNLIRTCVGKKTQLKSSEKEERHIK